MNSSNPARGGDGTVPWIKWNEAIPSCSSSLTIDSALGQAKSYSQFFFHHIRIENRNVLLQISIFWFLLLDAEQHSYLCVNSCAR